MISLSAPQAIPWLKSFLTTLGGQSKTSDIRETPTTHTREISSPKSKLIMESLHCPHCGSHRFVKRGFRKKVREKVQLYLCSDCQTTFTPHVTTGKRFPMQIVIDAVSLYNMGYSLEQSSQILLNRSGTLVPPSSLSQWLHDFDQLCRFSRMRPYALKKFAPSDMVMTATLAHRQLYRYRFHRAKCQLILSEDIKHRRFGPIREYLEMVPGECPHQYFQQGQRASETPLAFSKTQMIVRAKHNLANDLCSFALQGVAERVQRHETVQKCMLYNDSVTVATEVPVYLNKDDLTHLQTQLGFELYTKSTTVDANSAGNPKQFILTPARDLPRLITGHVDILQIRNGQIHLLDYKPQAQKERPIEQLTLYAMALSRLTGLRLFEFKCAWFDEQDYFEFYPLHVLHKPKSSRRRRKVMTHEGTYLINKNAQKIESLRPV